MIKLLLFKILKKILPIFACHIIKKLKEISPLCHCLLLYNTLLFWLCLRCEIEQQEQTRKNSILSLKLVTLCLDMFLYLYYTWGPVHTNFGVSVKSYKNCCFFYFLLRVAKAWRYRYSVVSVSIGIGRSLAISLLRAWFRLIESNSPKYMF